MAKSLRPIFRRVLVLLSVLGVGALLAFGWHRTQTLPLGGVEVAGAVHADADALVALAALPDSARLFEIEPDLIADRVERDPWVRQARVTRWMTGTLAVRVEERVPVALALDASGRPAHYLDADGFAMPATASALAAGFDVPLLVGALPPFRPTVPVEDDALRGLLAALAEAGPATDALISAVERGADGRLTLHTAAAPGGRSVPVALGPRGHAEQLRRLQAFWDQAILTRPDHPIRRIDLRFDGQIVTDES